MDFRYRSVRMSPELETLDQLQAGDLPLAIVRKVYPDTETFSRGILGLLSSGDVSLFTTDDMEVPRWRWRELFVDGAVMSELDRLKLAITDQGAHRIG
jgi:hypothetical protein